tara:strand:+ start:13 stop:348 length:336 start_codon:yes stop_codon:yes gene_type:complete
MRSDKKHGDSGGSGSDEGTSLATGRKKQRITLNDGKEYELEHLNLNLMIKIEDHFDQPMGELFEKPRVTHTRFVLWMRLKDQYPEIDSPEKLGEMVEMEQLLNYAEIMGVK